MAFMGHDNPFIPISPVNVSMPKYRRSERFADADHCPANNLS
jgi:hypothetical protein